MKRALAAVVLAVSATLAGCGGGGGSSSVQEFADSVCKSLATWTDDVIEAMKSDEASKVFAGNFQPTTLEEVAGAFKTLGTVFAQFDDSMGKLVEDLEGLDAPDVKDGEKFQKDFIAALKKGAKLFAAARKQIEGTDPTSVEDLAKIGPAMEEFGKAFDAIDVDYEDDAPEKLGKAFKDSKVCKDAEKKFEDLG